MKNGKAVIHFTYERETKNTYRYVEQAAPGFEQIGVLYVKKQTIGPSPATQLTVTIEERKQ